MTVQGRAQRQRAVLTQQNPPKQTSLKISQLRNVPLLAKGTQFPTILIPFSAQRDLLKASRKALHGVYTPPKLPCAGGERSMARQSQTKPNPTLALTLPQSSSVNQAPDSVKTQRITKQSKQLQMYFDSPTLYINQANGN